MVHNLWMQLKNFIFYSEVKENDMNVLCSTANYNTKPYYHFRDDHYGIQNGKERTKVYVTVKLLLFSDSLLLVSTTGLPGL